LPSFFISIMHTSIEHIRSQLGPSDNRQAKCRRSAGASNRGPCDFVGGVRLYLLFGPAQSSRNPNSAPLDRPAVRR
jgi:hypothetical protein